MDYKHKKLFNTRWWITRLPWIIGSAIALTVIEKSCIK